MKATALILAAGMGIRLQTAAKGLPKCLIKFQGRSLLLRHIDNLLELGIEDIVIATGFNAEAVEQELQTHSLGKSVKCVHNADFRLGSMLTLWTLRQHFNSKRPILVMDADVLYHPHILKRLVNSAHDGCFLLDRQFEAGDEPVKIGVRKGHMSAFGKGISGNYDFCGESVGFFRFSPALTTRLFSTIEGYMQANDTQQPHEDAIGAILQTNPQDFGFEDISGYPWLEIDFPEDLDKAQQEVLPRLSETPSKSRQLRMLLQSPSLEFLMEAHNGMSARIVEETGFRGIWGSGLALSAQYGVRDNNEASWTQVVEMLEFMSDASTIPILLDGDTGYGNFNNMRRLVRKLEQRDIAGVCIEDKLFPKTNSFLGGEKQALCEIEEFCGKIKAGKDSQTNSDFCIVARIEALIAGWGLDEALSRAEAYKKAGADAILIHSKRADPEEILNFAKLWKNQLPLVIVPTKYYSTPTEVFRQAGISTVIWANHLIRAATAEMKAVAGEIYRTTTLVKIEDRIAPVQEIFRLQGAEELAEAEQRYFSQGKTKAGVIILAASRGADLQKLTTDRPKVMVSVAGVPLLRRLVDTFKAEQVNQITVVAGYKPEAITTSGIQLVQNPQHNSTGELASLACAIAHLSDHCLISYGDLLFHRYILRDLLQAQAEITLVVDSSLPAANSRHYRDLAHCDASDNQALFRPEVRLQHLSNERSECSGQPQGRWIGLMRVQQQGRLWLTAALEELQQQANFAQMNMNDLFNALIAQGKPIHVLYIHGHWLDINNLTDLTRANDFHHIN